MLKHVSAMLGLYVGLNAAAGICEVSACAGELLADPVFEVQPKVGQEKASTENLPSHGVSFPTRLFGQHAAAYDNKMVRVATVQAPGLPSVPKAGTLKCSPESASAVNDDRLIAELTDEPNRSAPDKETDKETAVQAMIRLASVSRPGSSGRDRAGSIVQAVAAGSTEPQGPLSYPVNLQNATTPSNSRNSADFFAIPAPTPAQKDNSDDFPFGSLKNVKLELSILKDEDLPRDAGKEAREYMSKGGTKQNWPTASWVSFRPDRNTFPFEHNPLYFEDPNLERCGLTHGCLTELTSIAHFAGRIPILPYLMTVEPPCSLVRAKPDCPTCNSFGVDAYIPNPDEVHLGGVAVQAAMTVGFLFLIP